MNCPYIDERSENTPPPALSQVGHKSSSSYANYAKLHVPTLHSPSHKSTYIRKYTPALLRCNMISNRKTSSNGFGFASCLTALLDRTSTFKCCVRRPTLIDLEV